MRLDLVPPQTRDGWHVVVETPRGSHVKMKYDSELDVFVVSRPLILGMSYPYDWGFVPGTRADDGDPIDAMIYWETPTVPGLVVPCRALGVLTLDQKTSAHGRARVRNDRVLFLPLAEERTTVRDVRELSKRRRDELATFFRQVTAFTTKEVRILGWKGAPAAEALLRRSLVTK